MEKIELYAKKNNFLSDTWVKRIGHNIDQSEERKGHGQCGGRKACRESLIILENSSHPDKAPNIRRIVFYK